MRLWPETPAFAGVTKKMETVCRVVCPTYAHYTTFIPSYRLIHGMTIHISVVCI